MESTCQAANRHRHRRHLRLLFRKAVFRDPRRRPGASGLRPV